MKRKRSKRIPLIQNPPLAVDLVSFVGPGLASFVATKTFSRGVTSLVAKRFPAGRLQHVKVAGAVAAFAASYYGAHRVSKLEPYHTPIVVGSAIAMVQTVMHTYLPALRWLFADDAASAPALAGARETRAHRVATSENDAAAYAPEPRVQPSAATEPEADADFGTTFGESNLWGESTPDDVLDQMVS